MDYKIKCQVKNLTKYYGKLLVLDNISFDVYDGEFLCIVGPTGCGKTTFLNCLTGLTPITSGEILIDGIPSNPKRHSISYVFQEESCLWWRTIRDNIKLGLEIRGGPKRDIDKRVEEMLNLVNLRGFENYYPSQVSQSIKQRTTIARALAVNPDILLMDEPYGSLDLKLRYYLEDELRRIQKKLKTTVIFVTHNIEEAVYLGDRLIVLSQKPTRIKEIINIKLSEPRNLTDPELVNLRRYVTELIRWW